jgi:hypothetical protein
MNRFNGTGNGEAAEITVTPPDSLLKYEAPLFVGIESSNAAPPPQGKGGLNENNTKIEDMINSILPPRSLYLSPLIFPSYSFIENGLKNQVSGCKMFVRILRLDWM